MRGTGTWIPLLRVAGVRLHLDPLLPLLLVLVAATGRDPGRAALLLGVLLVFVVVHELAHALMARRRGLQVTGIFLHLFPVTYVQRGTPADEWRVALAGPAANLTLGLLLLAIGGPARLPHPGRLGEDLLGLVIAVNLALGLVNLLPFLPADGGRALRAWLLQRGHGRRAHRIVAATGFAAGLSAILLGALLVSWPEALYAVAVGLYLVYVAARALVGRAP